MDDLLKNEWFPEGFGNIGGLSFEKCFQSEKKFVKITMDGMSDATGIFKRWFDFCHNKTKDGQTPEISNGKNESGDKSH